MPHNFADDISLASLDTSISTSPARSTSSAGVDSGFSAIPAPPALLLCKHSTAPGLGIRRFKWATATLGKSEARKPKPERKPKSECPKALSPVGRAERISWRVLACQARPAVGAGLQERSAASSDFGFRPSFGFRISAFGFGPLAPSKPKTSSLPPHSLTPPLRSPLSRPAAHIP